MCLENIPFQIKPNPIRPGVAEITKVEPPCHSLKTFPNLLRCFSLIFKYSDLDEEVEN